MITLTPEYEELWNEKLDKNDAWRLASLSFSISGATSFTFTYCTSI